MGHTEFEMSISHPGGYVKPSGVSMIFELSSWLEKSILKSLAHIQYLNL